MLSRCAAQIVLVASVNKVITDNGQMVMTYGLLCAWSNATGRREAHCTQAAAPTLGRV